MTKRTKVHDGIIGVIVVFSAAMAQTVDPRWILLAGLTGLVMISSVFTGFCPVHYLVGKWVRP